MPTVTRVDLATRWLVSYLGSLPGRSAPHKDLAEQARAAGYNPQLLRRAVEKTGVVITSNPTVPRTTTWTLPEVAEPVEAAPADGPAEVAEEDPWA
jgi:hypothetical protein